MDGKQQSVWLNRGVIVLSVAVVGVGAYRMIAAVRREQSKSATVTRPLVVCGPSGVGKGTLLKMLQQEYPNMFKKTITHTTRKPRQGEVDGVDYHFTTREQMTEDIKSGKFVESAEVHGNLYGTSLAAIEAVSQSGCIAVLEIDVQGAEAIRSKTKLNPFFFFIHPPSFDVLRERLQRRGTENESTMQRRLNTAQYELDYSDRVVWFHHKMVNDDLALSFARLRDKLVECYPQMRRQQQLQLQQPKL